MILGDPCERALFDPKVVIAHRLRNAGIGIAESSLSFTFNTIIWLCDPGVMAHALFHSSYCASDPHQCFLLFIEL